MILSAIVFSILISMVILFQLALALGMPWGSLAMGGKFPGKFPPAMRVSCIIQILILATLDLLVLTKSNLMFENWYSFADAGIWFVVVFSAIATVLNLITQSKWEKRIWAPVSILMLISSIIVAMN